VLSVAADTRRVMELLMPLLVFTALSMSCYADDEVIDQVGFLCISAQPFLRASIVLYCSRSLNKLTKRNLLITRCIEQCLGYNMRVVSITVFVK